MRLSIYHSFLFFGILTLPCLTKENAPPPEQVGDDDHPKRINGYWSAFECYVRSDNGGPKLEDQCKEACFPGGVKSDVPPEKVVRSSTMCVLYGEPQKLNGLPLTAEEKKNPKSQCVQRSHLAPTN
jgi:hypothetical protein